LHNSAYAREKAGVQKIWSDVRKVVLLVLGTLSLVIGIIGAFLPVLPTTPFVLLAAFCYVRSSETMYAWLMRSRFAGKHVQGILAGQGIPLSVKILSVSISAVMIGYVSIVTTESALIRSLLGLLFLVQVYCMVRMRTAGSMRPTDSEQSPDTPPTHP
jgi:uncharacterized membrane protein YbaN (DUF454 family)